MVEKQFSDIEKLEKIQDVASEKREQEALIKESFQPIINEIDWSGELVIEGHEQFKRDYADVQSIIFACALQELPIDIEIRALVNEHNVPIHYFAEFEVDHEKHYADAFGVYYNEEDIASRIGFSGASELLDFDNDDKPAVRVYRDTEADLLDNLPGEDCGEQVEYAEVYYGHILLEWIGALSETLDNKLTSSPLLP